jgi:hypothetical protein
MKTTDLFRFNRSAERINESIEKTFGQRLNLESFDLPKLEDARNKLRTQIHDARSQSGFNENIENEAMTKAQWMLDAINAEIAEREEFIADAGPAEVEEGFGSIEEEVVKIMKQFDEDMLEIGGYGDPDIEGIASLLRQGDVEGALDEVYGSYSDQDGGELRNMDDYMDDLEAEFQELAQGGDDDEGGETDDAYALSSAGFGSDEDYESVNNEGGRDAYQRDYDSSVNGMGRRERENDEGNTEPPNNFAVSINGKQWKVFKGRGQYADDSAERKHYYQLKDWAAKKSESTGKKWEVNVTGAPATESIQRTQGESMSNLREGEVQQASAIVTAKTMVDRVSRWIEELSGMENDTLLQLGDSIRDEMSQEQAKTFISSVAPAIQQALENLKTTRETLATGVRMLTGEEQGAEMLGMEPGADMAGSDEMGPVEPDAMNAGGEELGGDDEFAAAEPAAGMGDAGREQRESIDRSSNLLRVLAG